MNAPASFSNALPSGTQLSGGAYAIDKPLGHGSFGITYLSLDARLNRPVAIKEFFPQGSTRRGPIVEPSSLSTPDDFENAKAKFLDEARSLARFHHTNIVQVLTFFEENNTAYMVMEYLQGKTLAQRVEESGALPEAEVVDIAREIGAALETLHHARLLHRDVNPNNVMLCAGAATGSQRVVLMDFGLTKELEEAISYGTRRLTGTTLFGTQGYAPPEQYVRHSQLTAATDIYALGATLYYLLTNEVPPAATERVMGGVALPEVRQVKPQVSREVSDAIMRAMETEVGKRPQNARAFLDLLTARPAPLPVAPAPPTPAPPTRVLTPTPLAPPPPRPAPTSTSPTMTATQTSTPIGIGCTRAALASALTLALGYFIVHGLPTWLAIAAVLCGLISWGSARRLRWIALLGIAVGGWYVVAAWPTLPSNSKPRVQPTPATAPAPAPVSATSELIGNSPTKPSPPSTPWIRTKVMGIWRGTFGGDAATLHIRQRKNNDFSGTLTIQQSDGTYKLAVEGTLLTDGRITMREDQVISQPGTGRWSLGTNKGILGNNNQSMSGTGSDSVNSPYSWSFRRVSASSPSAPPASPSNANRLTEIKQFFNDWEKACENADATDLRKLISRDHPNSVTIARGLTNDAFISGRAQFDYKITRTIIKENYATVYFYCHSYRPIVGMHYSTNASYKLIFEDDKWKLHGPAFDWQKRWQS